MTRSVLVASEDRCATFERLRVFSDGLQGMGGRSPDRRFVEVVRAVINSMSPCTLEVVSPRQNVLKKSLSEPRL